MKQYIDGQYIKTHVEKKLTLKERVDRKIRVDRDKRLLKALSK